MTKLIYNRNFTPRALTRDEWLTPFDRMFDDMLGSLFPAVAKDVGSDFFAQGSYPKVNVINNAEDVTIEAAIPGMEKDDVTVEVTDGILTISGASNQDGEIQDSQYVKREIKKSSFKRSFRLGENLDPESISGSYDKGVLTLVLPKVKPAEEESKTRTIKIS